VTEGHWALLVVVLVSASIAVSIRDSMPAEVSTTEIKAN
jgi:hypothetical protein